MKDKLVYLEWDDSSTQKGWRSKNRIDMSSHRIKTIGYLILEEKHRIAVTSSIDGDEDDYLDILTIPKTAILKRRNIKLPH